MNAVIMNYVDSTFKYSKKLTEAEQRHIAP